MSAFHTHNSELLARLLPPVSYGINEPRLKADLAAEGAALDAVASAANAFAVPVPWLFGHPALIPHWERLYQITPSAHAAIAQRQAVVLARINARGGLSLAYFKSLLTAEGYLAVVDEPRELRAGVGRAGDALFKQGSVTYYWRIRVRNANGSLVSELEKTRIKTWFATLAPAGTHFTIGD